MIHEIRDVTFARLFFQVRTGSFNQSIYNKHDTFCFIKKSRTLHSQKRKKQGGRKEGRNITWVND
jgi:hypothetical protein